MRQYLEVMINSTFAVKRRKLTVWRYDLFIFKGDALGIH
jgi:hypothetical protein